MFRNVTRNLRELLPQIIRNLIAFVTLLALNKAADRADAIGMEIFKTVDSSTFWCSPREWSFYVFWFALFEHGERLAEAGGFMWERVNL